MIDVDNVIKGLEKAVEVFDGRISCPMFEMWMDETKGAIALLKEHEKATIEPKRIEIEDETKAWLDGMGAVEALGNIANICMDWDGYRTADGLGGLVNEIWAYARYCADRLMKAQEPVKPLKMEVDHVRKEPVVFSYECPVCMCGLQRHWVACPICGRTVKWE